MEAEPEFPVRIPITGELDLHTFSPRDLSVLLPEYFLECRRRGIFEVRVIHGKGTGNLRRSVEALLKKDSQVLSYALGDEHTGSWGATLVQLRRDAK